MFPQYRQRIASASLIAEKIFWLLLELFMVAAIIVGAVIVATVILEILRAVVL